MAKPHNRAGPAAGVQLDRTSKLQQVLERKRLSRAPYERSERIDELYVMLTYDCNLRCRACILWGEVGACKDAAYREQHAGELPYEALERVIDDLAPFRPSYLTLAGGEPFLHSRWQDVAAHARRRGIQVSVTTNGVRIGEHLDDVLAYVDQVNVSLDGPPSVQEDVRPGRPGYYEAMVEGLRELSARRAETGGRPLVRIMCVISAGNYAHLVELIEFLAASGVEVDEYYFQHLIFNAPETLAEHARVLREEFDVPLGILQGYGMPSDGIDFDVLHAELRRARKAHPRVGFSATLDRVDLERYYAPDRGGARPGYCAGPWNQPNLLPDGSVWACPDITLGNVHEQRFADIWNGPRAARLRRRIIDGPLPGCLGCFSYYCDREA